MLSFRSVKTRITNQRVRSHCVWSGLRSVTGATVLSANQVFADVWKRAPSSVSDQNKRWCHVGHDMIGCVTLQAWLADPETMITGMMSHSLSASAGFRKKVLLRILRVYLNTGTRLNKHQLLEQTARLSVSSQYIDTICKSVTENTANTFNVPTSCLFGNDYNAHVASM